MEAHNKQGKTQEWARRRSRWWWCDENKTRIRSVAIAAKWKGLSRARPTIKWIVSFYMWRYCLASGNYKELYLLAARNWCNTHFAARPFMFIYSDIVAIYISIFLFWSFLIDSTLYTYGRLALLLSACSFGFAPRMSSYIEQFMSIYCGSMTVLY